MEGTSWEVLEVHRVSLTAFLRGKCRNAADIEDCVQETMLRAAQVPHLDPDRAYGLLKKIGYRLAMDIHRERQRRARAFARHGVVPQPSPDEMALDRQLAYELAARAATLSLSERQALRGRADGFNPSETATHLGVPAKTVHLALSRARTALKAAAGPTVILLWLRRRRGITVRAESAMTMAVAFAGLTFVLGQGEVPGPVTHPALPPFNRVLVARPEMPPSPVRRHPPTADAVAAPVPAPSQRSQTAPPRPATVIQVASPDPHTLQMGIGVTLSLHDESFVSGLKACLQPGAVSLDPHRAGCKG